jgi:outer membrane protein assembly factor BamB/tetratricopeptide (TPR) repeat protein
MRQAGGPGAPDANPSPPTDGFSSTLELPKDIERQHALEAVSEYIAEKDWDTACRTLDKLMRYPEDKMVEVTRVGKNGQQIKNWVSARREAERLIGELPPDGLEYYKTQFGPPAKEMLDKAMESGRKEDLAVVMNYYLHTDAGAIATHQLATRLLDRGDYITACLCYERLLNREGADRLPTSVMFEAAYAYHLAGNKDKEDEMWKQMRRLGNNIKIGNAVKGVDDLQEVIAKIERPATSTYASDFPMVNGGPGRNAQGIGGAPFLEKSWMMPLTHEDSESGFTKLPLSYIADAENPSHGRQAIIPASQPITVTVKIDGVSKAYVIYRTYLGIEAVELETGKLAWRQDSKWSIEKMLATAQFGKSTTLKNWLDAYIHQGGGQRPGIIFENSVIGTLSTDGTFVYAIEDLPVPPPPMPNFNGFPGNAPASNFGKEINDAIQCNTLCAYELGTAGKFKWTVGGRAKDAPLGESYFLGPPLPMGGKLYVLTEKQQELRLACIEPQSGKVLSTQVLVTTRDRIQSDVIRRISAAHMAYGEGILACPTNAGAILGVDLLTNSLVWAYSYREEPTVPNQPAVPGNPRFGNQPQPQHLNNSQWKLTPPIIQDGRVIFTAPDASSVHCLNLRDGTPVWSRKRAEDDLYLGGVYNGKVVVVGKRSTKAYRLTNGEDAWEVETGVPGGFGVASDNKYYVPVRESAASKEPEICVIDVDKGAAVAHAHSRPKQVGREIPGNLLFYEGRVLSQTERTMTAYPQLEVREKEITAQLQENPKNPTALTDRGELRLDRGDLQGAIEDLNLALDNNPNEATRAKARFKLYETLSDMLQNNFDKAESYLPRYEELCKNVEVDPNATAEQRDKALSEQRRRETNFLYLVAKGRQGQGKLVEAFENYQKFSKLAGTEKLISIPDDMAVRTAPDVWTAARIKKMVQDATPEQRKPLEDKIAGEWVSLQKNAKSLDEIRQFVRLFGSAFPIGREARLELADRLIESNEPQSLIEAELDLAMLRSSREDPAMAARAVETLARLNAQKGLLADAAFYYRELRDRYPKAILRDGKTGAQVFTEMESNKFLLPYLHESAPVSLNTKIGKVEEVKSPPQGFQNTSQLYTFDQIGEELPFFKQYRVALQTNTHQLKIINRYVDEPARMDQTLTPTNFQAMQNTFNPMNGQPLSLKFHFLNMGHLIVLPLGHLVFGIDPVEKKVLWEKNLYGHVTNASGLPPLANTNNMANVTVDPKDGAIQVMYADGWMQRIGQTSSLDGQVICLQTREGIVAIDPLSGRTLWTRADLSSRSQILSDAEHFYVIELNASSTPVSTRVLRAQDGVGVKVPDFAALYQKRVRMYGHNLLLTETDDAKKTVTLRLYDVLTAKDEWKQSFAAKSVALHSEDPNLTGVVEPDGKLHVFDMRRENKELFTARMEPKHIEKVQEIVLFSDDKNVYIACNGDVDPQMMPWGGVMSNLMPGTGLRSVGVNGEFYSFNKTNGELNWHNPVPNQMLVLEHFKEMPCLLFTARYNTWNKGPVKNMVINVVSTESIEKSTGKLKYYNENTNNQTQQFHSINADLKGGKIELIAWNAKLVHHLSAPDAAKGEKAADKEKPAKENEGAKNQLTPPGGG